MKVEKIYHLADLHIRNYQRHDEYRKVFNKFLKNVERDGIENSVIYIAGDIAHAKTDMSPELVSEISWFLTECSKLREVVLITGNHDCNLNNSSRLDVLTPIVDNLNNKRIHYLKDTGVYNIHNLTFVVYSILDDKENWPKGDSVSGENKICLFHGPVNKAQTDIGYTVSSDSFTTEIFDGFDMVLLGDIHKRQVLKESNPVIVYAGSTVQQNHGELLDGHGYLLWDVASRTFTEHDLYNEYGYLTVDVDNGKIPNWVITESKSGKLPTKPRIRLRYSNTNKSEITKVITELKKLFNVVEVTVTRTDTVSKSNIGGLVNKNIVGNVHDLDYQNKLLQDFLNFKISVSSTDIDDILKIHKEIHSQIDTTDFAENILWKPKTFEFSNMFSYGENNVIRFNKANGVIGIFAPNASGKSSMFDALAFCIFDKSSRTNVSKNILNNKKDEFYCKFNFEIDGVDYFIERTAKWTRKKQNLKVDVSFWKEKDGVIEYLNGEQRRETNKNIEKFLGKFDDFVLTTLSLQGNNSLFVDKSQSDRKEILSQFIGLQIFDRLSDVATDEFRGNNHIIKKFKSDDLTSELAEIDDKITTATDDFNKISSILSDDEDNLEVINDKINRLNSSLYELNDDTLDIDTLVSKQNSLSDKLKDINVEITDIENQKEKYENELSDNNIKLKEYDIDDLKVRTEKLKDMQDRQSNVLVKLENVRENIKSSEELIENFNSHKYNENCEVCLENSKSLLVQKNNEKKKLKELYEVESALKLDNSELVIDIGEYSKYAKDFEIANILLKNKSDLELSISKIETNLNTKKYVESVKIQNNISKVESLITEYNDNKEKIIKNKDIHKNINEISSTELNPLKDKIKNNKKLVLDANGVLITLKNRKKELEDKITEISELENKVKLYESYLQAVSKYGISYDLIENAIPKIEVEVNNILSQIVDFSIELEMDGKNINANLVQDDRKWSLEMCSGMERFISGLAIRVALINVCNLPRPNFLILDEGFGTLDSENLQSVGLLFSYLKTQFDFIFVISHIDSMRDMVDTSIDIEKINGFSKIRY